jgi:tetratricopeptide (TPR) repeat protein
MNSLSDLNKEVFEDLKFALSERNKSALMLIIFDTFTVRQRIHAIIEKEFSSYKHYNVDVSSENIVSLSAHLKNMLPNEILKSENISHIVNVFGLENSMLHYKDGKIQASAFIEQLNMERENLYREIPCILMLWLDSFSAQKIQEQALDFWDWLSYIFRFGTPEEQIDRTELKDKNLIAEKHFAPERFERIKELRAKLEKIDRNLPKERLFKEIKEIRILLASELLEVNKFEESIHNLQIVLNLPGKTEDSSDAGNAYIFHLLGSNYLELRQFDESLFNYKKSIELFEKTNNLSAIGRSYHQIGMLFHDQNKFPEALENYQKAIEWFEKTNNLSAIGSSYHQIDRNRLKRNYLLAIKAILRLL